MLLLRTNAANSLNGATRQDGLGTNVAKADSAARSWRVIRGDDHHQQNRSSCCGRKSAPRLAVPIDRGLRLPRLTLNSRRLMAAGEGTHVWGPRAPKPQPLRTAAASSHSGPRRPRRPVSGTELILFRALASAKPDGTEDGSCNHVRRRNLGRSRQPQRWCCGRQAGGGSPAGHSLRPLRDVPGVTGVLTLRPTEAVLRRIIA